MKRAFFILLILFVFGAIAPIYAQDDSNLSIPLTTIYATPDTGAKVLLQIPMDIRIIEISDDANWYKVKIAYDFGPLGKNAYLGWVNVPVGNILELRKSEKLARRPRVDHTTP